MDVLLTILDVLLPVNGCINASVGCIYGRHSLYDCIIGRGLYTLTNIHPDVYLPVVKMLCTHTKYISTKKHHNYKEKNGYMKLLLKSLPN